MGFVTTLTANNDFIHTLPKIDDLGAQLYTAISKLSIEQPVRVGTSGIMAWESHHADYAQPVLVGGGRDATLVGGISISWSHKEPELELLKQLAEKHGFVLHKKTKRK